ncbi:MAG: iron-containing alcohol dehydrogenase [Planctomycetota bacterium]|nr:iron-containing alcohol dehydrogenase [Planctomycetota bacterium]MDA1212753.1 iron-containing alcohol dehydrogenase [Planctomycetota bacterium]
MDQQVPTTSPFNTDTTPGIPGFDYDPRTRVVFGNGSVARLGELAREIGASRVLLVTDRGLMEAGHVDRALKRLRDEGIFVVDFHDVQQNPTTEDVERGLVIAREHSIDAIIGFGGGSSLDCAKGINFLLTNGGKMEDYWGVGKATRPMLPVIAVPTTAGTGSEAQSFALIAQAETHQKMACGDKKAACKIAILDPELTLTLPQSVAAVTGIDALSHAVESFVTTKKTPVSQLLSREAWKLLSTNYVTVLNEPDNLAARGAMLLGAHLAGAAIENSMLGAAHSLANPLSAKYGTIHGVAVGIMLPHVVRFNGECERERYATLAEDAGLQIDASTPSYETLAKFLIQALQFAGLPVSLEGAGVARDSLPQLAQEAAQQWTAQFNPRPVDVADLLEVYQCAFSTNGSTGGHS